MMKEDYQSSIKEIFEEFIGSKVTESKKMVSEQTITYTAYIENSSHTLKRKMDVNVNGKYERIQIVVYLEQDIPKQKHPAVRQMINDMQKEWLYVRLYLTDESDLAADYCMIIKKPLKISHL